MLSGSSGGVVHSVLIRCLYLLPGERTRRLGVYITYIYVRQPFRFGVLDWAMLRSVFFRCFILCILSGWTFGALHRFTGSRCPISPGATANACIMWPCCNYKFVVMHLLLNHCWLLLLLLLLLLLTLTHRYNAVRGRKKCWSPRNIGKYKKNRNIGWGNMMDSTLLHTRRRRTRD